MNLVPATEIVHDLILIGWHVLIACFFSSVFFSRSYPIFSSISVLHLRMLCDINRIQIDIVSRFHSCSLAVNSVQCLTPKSRTLFHNLHLTEQIFFCSFPRIT